VASDSRAGFDTEYVSPQITRMIGYTPEEVVRDPDLWYDILHPDDRAAALRAGAEHLASGAPLRQEYRVVARDGRVVWVRDEAAVLPGDGGSPRFSQGILSDITDSKAVEETLRESEEELRRTIEMLRASDLERRQLVSRLVSAREEEAQRIASAIHDDPIQKLSAAALRLGILRKGAVGDQQSETIAQIQGAIDETMTRLRRMLFELSPRTLETGGLGEALQEYVHYANQEGGPLYHLQDQLGAELGQETRTIAYRVILEALSNVRKHAAAQNVTVSLADMDGGVYCGVKDDGRGIAPEDLGVSRPGHMGTASMRERVEMAEGWFKIHSQPGQGTTVDFWLPGG
jgi:two-component system sensor histidine kinase UhpB